MSQTPRVFLDTSVIFAGIWSATGGSRRILQLGQAREIQLLISQYALDEIRDVLARKAPDRVAALPALFLQSGMALTAPATSQHLKTSQSLITYYADALVLASALTADVDYFVTLDKKHFLDNALLKAAIPFKIGTPGDFLAWYRALLLENS